MKEEEVTNLENIIKKLLEENRLNTQQVLKESRSTMEQQYATIDLKLDNIQAQTERTNGRVTRLELDVKTLAIDDQKHYNSCPNSVKLELLQKEVSQVVSSKSFIAKTIGWNSVILSILLSIVTLSMYLIGKK
jgi:hypothetical protein